MITPLHIKNERDYISSRLTFLIIITLFSFIVTLQLNTTLRHALFFVDLYLLGLLVLSILHYLYIKYYQNSFIHIRKIIPVFLDIFVLTLIINVLSQYGLYLFPLYIIIVMRSGYIFGMGYFYLSIILASISWVSLLLFSPYWAIHYHLIAIFAITTLIVPLFYFKLMMKLEENNEILQNYINSTEYAQNHDLLTGLYNRNYYKKFLKSTIEKDIPFSLFFININKLQDISYFHGLTIVNQVLIEIAKRLDECMEENDFLAKINTDEFVIITTRKKIFISSFVKHIEQHVFSELRIKNHKIPIQINIGISQYPQDTRSPLMLSKYADDALEYVTPLKHTSFYFYADLKK